VHNALPDGTPLGPSNPADPGATAPRPDVAVPDPDGVSLVALPHTGLRVPHTRLGITGYRELVSACGIAFTATLRLDTAPVGVVFNEGSGGATSYHPHSGSRFTGRDLVAFTVSCRTASGQQPDVESVLDNLVSEDRTARRVNRLTRRNETPLRLVTLLLDDGPDLVEVGHASAAPLTTDDQIRRLAGELAESDPPEPGEWWQRWNGHTWIDLNPRNPTSPGRDQPMRPAP
jgi:hypothetical protein